MSKKIFIGLLFVCICGMATLLYGTIYVDCVKRIHLVFPVPGNKNTGSTGACFNASIPLLPLANMGADYICGTSALQDCKNNNFDVLKVFNSCTAVLYYPGDSCEKITENIRSY
jgi:hypothetical protein